MAKSKKSGKKIRDHAGNLIKQYRELRDDLTSLRAEFDDREKDIQANMDELERRFVVAFNKQINNSENPITTISTKAGSCYRTVTTSVRISDADAFRQWILEDPENRIYFLESRAAKLSTLKYLTEEGLYSATDKDAPIESFDGAPVPGISITKMARVIFVKPTAAK